MSFQNTTETYGFAARFLHWTSALIMLALIIAGFAMGALEGDQRYQVVMLHKSFGLVILGLVVARIIWLSINPHPKSLTTHQPWEKALSKIIHILLYFGMIAMPLSGWAMSSAGEYPVRFFGLFDMPPLTGKNEGLYRLTNTVHEIGGYAIVAAVGLHFLGAAKHHILDKDSTLRRMGGNMIALIVLGLMLAAGAGLAGKELAGEIFEAPEQEQAAIITPAPAETTAPTPANLQGWTIDKSASKLALSFNQYGQDVHGAFGAFDGTIIFDPADLSNAKAEITIQIASLDTGTSDRNTQSQSPVWFDAQKFPTAQFVAESFTSLGANRYEAKGSLTIRDKTLPITLPFTLDISDSNNAQNNPQEQTAHMQSEFSLNRLDFGVGQGEWEKTDAIKDAVHISIDLKATRHIAK